ncbi:hypothetical protein [Streptomyces sp. LaBMicrA B280]|uniref:hypothetical protein n=1 Tax=Streptomyces sp. LaBMicrA B280 TaxID=3391001 RepID=UPI003BA81A57
MPEQQLPQPLTESELNARFRRLAEAGTAPVPTSGAQVRDQAVRRRRNRRAALSTAALAAAALTVLTTGVLDSPTGPAAPPATSVTRTTRPAAPFRTPVQRVTVDLNSEVLDIKGKGYGIAVPVPICPIGETRVTVTAKYPTLTTPGPAGSGMASPLKRWVVTFTDRHHHERLLFWALDPSESFVSVARNTSGSLVLPYETGKEVYDAVGPGTRVDIKGWQAANAQPDSLCPDRRPITGTH